MSMTASERLKKAAKDPGLLQELGGSGLEQYNGLIHEEFLAKLSGRMGQLAFREMELNDPIVGAMLYSLEMLMRSVNWNLEPAVEDDAEAEKHAEFIEEVFGDMEHDWAGFIGEWMAAPVYGFAPFEIIWKIRKGYDPNPGKRSKYTDGKIGVSRLAIRHPVTLYRWLIDEEDGGRIIGMEQSHLTTQAVIPAEKLLLFTVLQRKGNPEGTSLLRRCFIPYYRKKKIEEVEGIGIERELNGLPVMHVPSEWFLTTASAEEQALLAYAKKIVKRVKVDEQNGLVLPMFLDDAGNQLLKFELLSAGGRRAIDTGPVKEYYSRQMAMSILMDVIMVGHEQVGSFALASSKTSLMGISIGALLDSIETVINRDLIPRLMTLNGLPPEMSPRLKHGDIETPDLEVLGTFMNNLTAAGFQLFPTESGELERMLLRAANLPDDIAEKAPERFAEAEEQRAAMAEAATLAAEQGQAAGAGQGEEEKPFGKYDPSQPRDDMGRWSDTGATDRESGERQVETLVSVGGREYRLTSGAANAEANRRAFLDRMNDPDNESWEDAMYAVTDDDGDRSFNVQPVEDLKPDTAARVRSGSQPLPKFTQSRPVRIEGLTARAQTARSPVLKRKPKPAASNPVSAAVLTVADRQANKLAAAFTGSLVVLRNGVDQERLQVALERGDVGAAVNAFPWDLWARTFERMAVPRIQETMRQSGEAAGRKMKLPVRKYDPNQPRDPAGTATGGQWSGGGGVDVPSNAEAALAAIGVADRDPDIPTGRRVPFDVAEGRRGAAEALVAEGQFTESRVRLSELTATQSGVRATRVRAMLEAWDAKPESPQVASLDGKLYIVDGHHRLSALSWAGNEFARVRIYGPGQIAKVEFTLQGVFDLMNPRAYRIAAEIAGQLVTRIQESTRQAIREVVADALRQGVSVRRQAQSIRQILVDSAGLDGPRARRLATFERALTDRGAPPSVVAQRVEEYRDRLITDRARTIARHETQSAAVAGQEELWAQAADAGLIDATMQLEWITADDERTCPLCAPMDGQKVPRGQLFVQEDGTTVARPPLHIQCRCTLALVEEAAGEV